MTEWGFSGRCWIIMNGKVNEIKNTVFSSLLYLIFLVNVSKNFIEGYNFFLFFESYPDRRDSQKEMRNIIM